MENDFLTGKKLNDTIDNISDEAVDALLRRAQEQLDRDMGDGGGDVSKASANVSSLEAKRKAEQERFKKEQENLAEVARREQERLSREKAEKERIAREKAEKERRDRAELERIQQEERERIERERREKALREQEAMERLRKEQEKFAREEAEKLAREKEQERLRRHEMEKKKAEQEKRERDKLLNEKAEKERIGKELASYDKNSEAAKPSNMPKVYPDSNTVGDAGRLDIMVKNKGTDTGRMNKAINDATKETAATIALEDNIIVDDSIPAPIRKEGITAVDVIGGFFEFVWTVFKLAVVISVVTAIVGFFLSREMLVRGRNGNLKSLNDMQISQTIMSNKDNVDEKVKEWIKVAKPEKLTLESDDGYILVARRIIANKDNSNWVVLMHGYNGSMEDVYDIAMRYTEKGYNVLMPDLRASGESEGSFIGMGWLDRLDVINWIDVIIADNPSANIILHGEDMGADTALMISGEPIKSNIKGIVAEGAYTSAWEVLQKEFKLRHEKWPVFPMMEMINPVAKVWGGYSLREASAVKQVAKTSVPILLIQGGQDTYVTDSMAAELEQSIASSHEMVVIPGGTHETCRYADPDTFYNRVFDFVAAHTK